MRLPAIQFHNLSSLFRRSTYIHLSFKIRLIGRHYLFEGNIFAIEKWPVRFYYQIWSNQAFINVPINLVFALTISMLIFINWTDRIELNKTMKDSILHYTGNYMREIILQEVLDSQMRAKRRVLKLGFIYRQFLYFVFFFLSPCSHWTTKRQLAKMSRNQLGKSRDACMLQETTQQGL